MHFAGFEFLKTACRSTEGNLIFHQFRKPIGNICFLMVAYVHATTRHLLHSHVPFFTFMFNLHKIVYMQTHHKSGRFVMLVQTLAYVAQIKVRSICFVSGNGIANPMLFPFLSFFILLRNCIYFGCPVTAKPKSLVNVPFWGKP